MKSLKDPFEVLSLIVKNNFGATAKTIRDAAREEFSVAPGTYAELFFADWYDRNISRVPVRQGKLGVETASKPGPRVVSLPARKARKPLTQAEREEREREDERFEREFFARGILNYMLPNGKRVKDCTAGELRAFGGWFVDLAKGLRDNQLIGNNLSNDDAERLYHRHFKNKKKVA
ncbi:hypothetical protein [Bradyrhizobium sp. RT10b]|uniref:hypothetical protein n=1 Tax=Bradyrhizobium sp. RT10b TaxID=3156331 RepID=UPI003391DA94